MKNKICYVVVLLLSFAVTGCSFFHKSSVSRRSEVLPRQDYVIIRKERLAKGGNLLVMPFSAGVNVAATDDLDRVSLRIIQGMAETFQGNSSKFSFLMADNANTAEIVLRGHITRMAKPGKLKKTLPGQKKVLTVQGEAVDAKTQEVLLKFTLTRKSENSKENFENLGSRIGVELAEQLTTLAP